MVLMGLLVFTMMQRGYFTTSINKSKMEKSSDTNHCTVVSVRFFEAEEKSPLRSNRNALNTFGESSWEVDRKYGGFKRKIKHFHSSIEESDNRCLDVKDDCNYFCCRA